LRREELLVRGIAPDAADGLTDSPFDPFPVFDSLTFDPFPVFDSLALEGGDR
jgi:hypothetical protein